MVILAIIIGVVLGLIGHRIEVRFGWSALTGLAILVVLSMAIVWAQTSINVGVLVMLMPAFSATNVAAGVLGERRAVRHRG